jgi:hypothetical protein
MSAGCTRIAIPTHFSAATKVRTFYTVYTRNINGQNTKNYLNNNQIYTPHPYSAPIEKVKYEVTPQPELHVYSAYT